MLTINFLIYFSSGAIVGLSLSVVLVNNPIFSLLFLILCFIFSSFLLFLLECEFLALIFITIYVGAIAVLFLFSIMMLDFKKHNLQKNVIKFLPVSICFGFVIVIFIIKEINDFFPETVLINSNFIEINLNWFDFLNSTTEIETVGKILFSHFALNLLLIGIILLVVLFGVVHLTSSIPISNKNSQVLFKQLSKSIRLNNTQLG